MSSDIQALTDGAFAKRAPWPRWAAGLLWFFAVLTTIGSLALAGRAPKDLLDALFGDGGAFALTALQDLLALGGIVGAWFCLGRRAYRWALVFIVLQVPVPLVIAANSCETPSACEDVQWLRLPQAFFNWRISLAAPHDAVVPAPVQSPAKPGLGGRLNVYPVGAELPATFRQQARRSDLGGHSSCFGELSDDEPCDAYVLDIYGEGRPSVLLVAPNDRSEARLAGEIFHLGADGAWAKSGELVVTCPEPLKALRAGVFGFAAPKARDLVLAGRQFNLLTDPEATCARSPAPRGALDRPDGALATRADRAQPLERRP